MPATTNSHSLRSVSTTASSKSGSAPMNNIHGGASPAYPVSVARSANHNHQSQVASAPASIGRGSGYTIANGTHLDVTSGASSPNSAPSMNESHKNTKPATGEKMFDFKYKNVYTTPPTRSGGRMTRGRATIGSGSGAGSGMGSCSIM